MSRQAHRIAAIEMEKYGLKGPHAFYLIRLSRHPDGVTATELAEMCDKDKADVSRSMALMQQKGLVARSGKTGGYRARLMLTDEGMIAAQAICRKAERAVEIAGDGLTADDRIKLYEMLDLISENLIVLCKEGLPE